MFYQYRSVRKAQDRNEVYTYPDSFVQLYFFWVSIFRVERVDSNVVVLELGTDLCDIRVSGRSRHSLQHAPGL